MKNITYILLLFSFSVFGQRPNNFNDSTYFARSVRFAVPPYIIQGAGNGKVLTSDANGRATWETFSSSGVSQGALNDSINAVRSIRKVDTLYRNLDSLVFKISGIRYAIKDSSGGGVTQQALDDSIARLDSTINAIPVPTLQTVTDAGAITTNHIGVRSIEVGSVSNFGSIDIYSDSPSGFYTRILGANGMSADNVLTLPVDITTASYIPLTVNGIKADMYGNILLPLITSDSLAQIRQEISDTATQIRSEIPNVSNFITSSSTNTLINKRITARVDSTASSATPAINTDNVDTYKLTAQAVDITSFTTNLSGTPTDDQILHIVIIGTATRAITWGSKFEASTVALPTTTVSTDRLDVYFIWNTATSKWRCGGVW